MSWQENLPGESAEPVDPTPSFDPARQEKVFCYRHPERETYLRCNRCERPMCVDCAVRTPTGYRCKECVAGQQKLFDTALPRDYVIAFVVALVLSYFGSYAARLMGFFTLFVAPIVGMIIVEVVRWLCGRRRSRTLTRVTVAASVIGALPLLVMGILNLVLFFSAGRTFQLSMLWPLLIQGLYVFLVGSAVFSRLSGLHLR